MAKKCVVKIMSFIDDLCTPVFTQQSNIMLSQKICNIRSNITFNSKKSKTTCQSLSGITRTSYLGTVTYAASVMQHLQFWCIQCYAYIYDKQKNDPTAISLSGLYHIKPCFMCDIDTAVQFCRSQINSCIYFAVLSLNSMVAIEQFYCNVV